MVGKLKYPFNQNDSIFDLSEPCKQSLKSLGVKMKDFQTKTKECEVCKIAIQDVKKIVQCDFCALFGC